MWCLVSFAILTPTPEAPIPILQLVPHTLRPRRSTNAIAKTDLSEATVRDASRTKWSVTAARAVITPQKPQRFIGKWAEERNVPEKLVSRTRILSQLFYLAFGR